MKGYLNFFIDRATYAEKVIGQALHDGERYGADDSGAGKTVVLDYSSINIAKRFHIGHLSTTMIGNSLYRLHKFFGWNAVGVNHLGDWGTQFGKMIAAYKRWGDHGTVAAGGVDEMVKLYVRFNQEAKADPALDDEGRMWFKRIEDGNPEALEIFNWFKSVTLKDAERVYDMLGVKFDSYAGESFYNDKMQPIIDDLRRTPLNDPLPEGYEQEEDDRSKVQALHERIAMLPEPDRSVVAMQLEGYSYDEIAKALGMTVKNVSVRLVRIKEKIRKEWT